MKHELIPNYSCEKRLPPLLFTDTGLPTVHATFNLLNRVSLADYHDPQILRGEGLTGLQVTLAASDTGSAILLEERPATLSDDEDRPSTRRTLIGIEMHNTMRLTGPYGVESCRKFLMARRTPEDLGFQGVFFPTEGAVFVPAALSNDKFWLRGFGRQALRERTQGAQTFFDHVQDDQIGKASPSLTFSWEFDALEVPSK